MVSLSINVVQYRINILLTLLNSDYLVYFVHNIDIAMLYDIKSTSCRHRIPLNLCLHRSYRRHRNVLRYRINIVSTSPTSNRFVYIVHNIDIVMEYDIELTSCRNRLHLITLITSSTLQCCTISNQHSADIAYHHLPCLHRSHRRHRNLVRYRINTLSKWLILAESINVITYTSHQQEAHRPKRSSEYQILYTDFLSEGRLFAYQQPHNNNK